MKWFVCKNFQWKTSNAMTIDRGWGNGYVAVSPSHPLWGVDYNSVEIEVHGGLTYSAFNDSFKHNDIPKNYWVFGFDTSHYNDSLKRWPKEAVEAETKRLFCQLMEIEIGEL